jgi:D-alanyl-D-alanine carboxypeptidase (penicillin-binding protein 5/6)
MDVKHLVTRPNRPVRMMFSIIFLTLSPIAIAEIFVPEKPVIAARSYILIDAATGTTIAESQSNVPAPPASLTKVMTSYIVAHELKKGTIKLTDNVFISPTAWRTGGSKTFIREGMHIKLEDLVHGMIIQSGNDASVALAEHIAGSEQAFADLMNHHAKLLGMTNSHFMNATGLPDPNHYTTPNDMSKLARALITQHPGHYRYYSQKSFTFNGIKQGNRNLLLYQDPTVDGIKTGHTDEAGYCLAASAVREGRRLISIVFGTESTQIRAQESQKLLGYGFRFFTTHTAYTAKQPLASIKVWGGTAKEVSVGPEQSIMLTLPKEAVKQLSAKVEIENDQIAPIKAGQTLGSIKLFRDQKLVASQPLVALAEVPEAPFWEGIWSKLYFKLTQLIKSWFA